jgi:hypothetical protein
MSKQNVRFTTADYIKSIMITINKLFRRHGEAEFKQGETFHIGWCRSVIVIVTARYHTVRDLLSKRLRIIFAYVSLDGARILIVLATLQTFY